MDLHALLDMFDDDDGAFDMLYDSLSSEDKEEQNEMRSRVGKSQNKNRDFVAAHAGVINNCFNGGQSVHSEADFKRRFRVPRDIHNGIHDRLMNKGPFVQKQDATGEQGIHPLVKLIACFRFIAHGNACDREDENLHLAESTLRLHVRDFCALVIEEFGEQHYNRSPSKEEREAISLVMAADGFQGCIGSWDCKHCPWKTCPMRLAGQHQGHAEGGKKTLMMEAISDHRRHIWHCNFGDAGMMNDINVLDKSSIVGAMLKGTLSLKTEIWKG